MLKSKIIKNKTIAFDLMAHNSEHCLYHLGFLKNYTNVLVILHTSSSLIEANQYYKGAQFNLQNVRYFTTFQLLFRVLINLILRKPIVFIGLHLWQACLFIPLIAINGNCTIHLHGQSYALARKSLKYYIWLFISFFSFLEVSNPAWKGPNFVKKIININQLNKYLHSSNKNNKVIFYSAIGKDIINLNLLKKRIEDVGLDLHISDIGISYKSLDILLSNFSYIYFESTDDYYFYSPSGRISDALNYGLTLVLKKEDHISISVAKSYSVDYITI
jgi:hypothetical protein